MTRFKSLTTLLIISVLVGTIPTSFSRAQIIAPLPVIDASVAGTTAATTAAVGTAASAELAAKTAQTTSLILVVNNPADQAALRGVTGASTAACEGIKQSEEIASTADSFGDFTLIGGGAAQATKLTAKINALQVVKTCRTAQLTAVSALVPTSATGAESFSKKQNELSTEIAALDTRIESLKQQQTAEVKDVLKAVMVRIVLNLSKSLTTEVVNKLVDKYKITDYLAYGDALATQVYSMKYINENYSGDARQQMMIRSLLQSEKFPEKINTVKSMANDKANEYLGQACNVASGTTAQDDNYFLKCLAAYGSPQANPIFHTTQAYDQAQAANAAGQASANSELSQSNGFAPPRNCEGSLGMQNQIDSQFDASAQTKDVAVLAAQKLKNALDMVPPRTTREEYQKAQAAADQAIANSLALGKQTSNPIIDICKGIDSPSSFVSDSIDKFLQKALVSDTDLKTDNLPFYASFLADVSSNFLTNILTGGKSSSQVLKEAGVGALNGALVGVLQSGQSQGTTGTPANPMGTVVIYARPEDSQTRTTNLVVGKAYVMGINFKELIATTANGKDPIFNPYKLVISGAADDSEVEMLITEEEFKAGNKAFDFTPGKAGTYNIRVKVAAKGTDGKGDVPLGEWSQKFTVSGAVKGDATFIPSNSAVMPRGPQVTFR